MTPCLDDASRWWAAQRRRYNTAVIVAGIICFGLYLMLAAGLPDVELTMFTLGFQVVGGAVYLAVANAAYSLGGIIERRLHPTNIPRFRSSLFRIGVALTAAPFVAVPLLLIYRRATGN